MSMYMDSCGFYREENVVEQKREANSDDERHTEESNQYKSCW